MPNVDISGLSKAAVLAALYNNSRAFEGSVLEFDSGDMSEADAREYLMSIRTRILGPKKLDFDYVKGRRVKVDLSNDSFDSRRYDEALSPGLAARVIHVLRKTGSGGRIAPFLVEDQARVAAECFSFRDEANAIVAYAVRNGPIENLHAGKHSELLADPDLCRITDEEMKEIMITACQKVEELLLLREEHPDEYERKLRDYNERYCRGWNR